MARRGSFLPKKGSHLGEKIVQQPNNEEEGKPPFSGEGATKGIYIVEGENRGFTVKKSYSISITQGKKRFCKEKHYRRQGGR